MPSIRALSADALYRPCDPAALDFETTDQLEGDGPSELVGQPRAVEALRFGLRIPHPGYHIFAFGPPGTGMQTLVERFIRDRVAEGDAPVGLCYVNNFDKPNHPLLLSLPAGAATALAADMAHLVDEMASVLPSAFEGEAYHARRKAIEEELEAEQAERFDALRAEAKAHGLAMLHTPMGIVFAPLAGEEVLSPEAFRKLPEPDQERLRSAIEAMQEALQTILRQVPRLARELRSRTHDLDREVTDFALGQLFEDLRGRYAAHPAVLTYLEAVRADLLDNAKGLLDAQDGDSEAPPAGSASESGAMRRYRVNLLVDHGPEARPPLVFEDNPTLQNLVGRVEHIAQMGALLTDFNLIEPGALHRANGGFLVLDARKLLTQPFAWEALKRSLESRRIRIESAGQALGLVSTMSLEPEPAPLEVKVVLIGEPLVYYLLCAYDPEFPELFKIAADFDDEIDRDATSERRFARQIAQMARAESLRPLDRAAVARVIEHAARLTGDAERLSARSARIADLLREADQWAAEAGRQQIGADLVQRAIDAQTYRSDRLRGRVQQAILRDTLHIATDGARVGQVNGLSVLQLGAFAFGRPSRITARVQLGEGKVIDIEREVELGGPLHSKGVLILSSFLGAHFGLREPLSLRASLVFEQSYGGVDGDSASSAELYALLSAIAEQPLDQSIAVTGALSQLGEVLPIGGVNEKIEGFFDICAARGLTGRQGVMIPEANVPHLMLRGDVVAAVAEGRFQVYAVRHVDAGIERLCGLPLGEPDGEGRYAEGTLGHAVQQRLSDLAARRRAFAGPAGDGHARSSGSETERDLPGSAGAPAHG